MNNYVIPHYSPERPHDELPRLMQGRDLAPFIFEAIDDRAVTAALLKAIRVLAELNGLTYTLPNPVMLLDMVVLQESKASNEIENIVTTQDELFKGLVNPSLAGDAQSPSATEKEIPASVKEVLRYREAMYKGIDFLTQYEALTTRSFVEIMRTLRGVEDDVRRTPGTALRAGRSGKVVYTPPEGEDLLRTLLGDLEAFLHEAPSHIDPLLAMAIGHFQFEAIHPFSDGNGRTGRIINVLHLVQQKLLRAPILYLSGYITEHKSDYYRGLRGVTESGDWTSWLVYMLEAVRESAEDTRDLITQINDLKTKQELLAHQVLPRGASRSVQVLFQHPYTKIKTLEIQGVLKRQAGSEALRALEKVGIVRSERIGRETYFINSELMAIFNAL